MNTQYPSTTVRHTRWHIPTARALLLRVLDGDAIDADRALLAAADCLDKLVNVLPTDDDGQVVLAKHLRKITEGAYAYPDDVIKRVLGYLDEHETAGWWPAYRDLLARATCTRQQPVELAAGR